MAETHDQKQQITAALTELRIQVRREGSVLKRTLGMKQYILASIEKHPWEWASCGAIFGWLLSGIPARKKRIYINSSSQKPGKGHSRGPLGHLGTVVWKFSKPIMVAYLAENAKTFKKRWT